MSERKKELAKAVAFNALQAYAKRNSNRGILDEGSSHDVKLVVTGKVDRISVSEIIMGKLTVGTTNSTGSTSKPDQAKLLAVIIDQLPKTRLEKLLKAFDAGLGTPTDESLKTAELILAKLSEKRPRKGSVKFQNAA